MYTKLSIPERLKDLRVVDKHLTLEQLAEQTGLSRSALGKYESDDYKDISPFAIATLAEFYGVSTDYLMGLTDNKEVPNANVQSLHLNDEMIELLRSGKINNRLLCELATHPNFRRLIVARSLATIMLGLALPFIVPYGLYRAEGFVSANLARKTTGFDEDDLALLWKAILNMFENDRSAARGMMAVRKLVIFKHDSELGEAPAWKLFKLVDVQRKPEITAPRSFEDYQFHVDTDHLPQGVTCQIME